MDKPARESAFGKLLSEASKQIIEEEDLKFASDYNAKEELWRLRQRMREEKAGAKLALQLSEEEFGFVKGHHPFRRADQGKENRRQDRQLEAIDDFEIAVQIAEEEKKCLAKSSRRKEQIMETDFKFAEELQEQLLREEAAAREETLRRDAELALLVHSGFIREKREQESKDAELARRISNRIAREEHRLLTSGKIAGDANNQGKSWSNAEVGVEDVAGGVCIFAYLPGAVDVSVRCERKSIVTIDACKVEATGTIRFSADVQLEGVDICEEDVSFEYASEDGVLFAYVEAVHLRNSAPLILSDLREKVSKGLRRLLGIKK